MSKQIIKGQSISLGIGVGGIYVSHDCIINSTTPTKITSEDIETEITSLEVAICKTYIEIYDLYNGYNQGLTKEEKKIIEVYHAILDDVYFFDELKQTISKELISAENALDICTQKYIDEIKNSNNDYAKQRIYDLNDIKTRLIKNISCSSSSSLKNVNSSHIVILKELTPTIAVLLGRKKVQGVISQEGGGYLSHASIILRSLGIPALNGIDYSSISHLNEEFAILDGFEGHLLIDPDDPDIERYREMFLRDKTRREDIYKDDILPTITRDNYKLNLSANISNLTDYKSIKNKHIDGIGLVRTETMFINSKKMPSETRQAFIYSRMAKQLNPRPIVFRTVDIGGDKIPSQMIKMDDFVRQNLRGIQWSLNHLDEFISQLRAFIIASRYGNVHISLPMVETADEIIKCKELIKIIRADLNTTGNKIKKLKIGSVIETTASVKNIDKILANVNFISIGTNDLLNQVMGLNRKYTNSANAEYFEPEFLHTLSIIIKKANSAKIPVSVCGEMASDPLAAVILIGLGADSLSVGPSSIPIIKRTIRDLYFTIAKELSDKTLECDHIDEVRRLLTTFIDTRLW